MNEKDSLIVKQQLEIKKLKWIVSQYTKQLDKIDMILHCVGGPLNDRFFHYNKRVEDSFISKGYYLAGPLIEIDKLCETIKDIENFIISPEMEEENNE